MKIILNNKVIFNIINIGVPGCENIIVADIMIIDIKIFFELFLKMKKNRRSHKNPYNINVNACGEMWYSWVQHNER